MLYLLFLYVEEITQHLPSAIMDSFTDSFLADHFLLSWDA